MSRATSPELEKAFRAGKFELTASDVLPGYSYDLWERKLRKVAFSWIRNEYYRETVVIKSDGQATLEITLPVSNMEAFLELLAILQEEVTENGK